MMERIEIIIVESGSKKKVGLNFMIIDSRHFKLFQFSANLTVFLQVRSKMARQVKIEMFKKVLHFWTQMLHALLDDLLF